MDCPRVVALVPDEKRPTAHWRIVRPFVRLREQGVDARWCWLDDDGDPILPIGDAVVVLYQTVVKGRNRRQVGDWIRRLRKAGARAVVYEADDDIWSPACLDWRIRTGQLYPGDRDKALAEMQKQLWTMQACDAVTVSTFALADVAKEYTDAPVYVVPNAIDVPWFLDHLMPRPEWRAHKTVGWAGSRRPESDLEPLAQAWARIAARFPRVKFVVAGWQHDVIYRYVDLERIITVPWREIEDYPSSYCVDVGCAIVPDDEFSACKSPIKAWEYGVAGAAVVASPLYEWTGVDGRDLRIAETVDEWEWSIRAVLENDNHRDYLVRNHRERIGAAYSLSAGLHAWSDAYRAIVDEREGADAGAHQLVAG